MNSETRGVGAFLGDVWHRSHYADLAFGSDPAIDDERTFPGCSMQTTGFWPVLASTQIQEDRSEEPTPR
jgi:hypothetical protein